jgi:RNA polymerase sigma factor (sigma-70 family)
MMTKAVSSPILQLIRRVVEDQSVRQLSDHHLLRQFSDQRDEAAFGALLRRHGPMVLDVCRSVLGNEADVEDAFQATLLILVRKSPSIRKTASVGSWLHGVAYRTALKARVQSAARQKMETRAPARQVCEPDDVTWREVRQVLHEELSGLTERYRVPLVLCYLEGKTQDAAASRGGAAGAGSRGGAAPVGRRARISASQRVSPKAVRGLSTSPARSPYHRFSAGGFTGAAVNTGRRPVGPKRWPGSTLIAVR